MRTVTSFQSEKFNTTKPREYFINPCCFGDDLCNWLIGELTADGVKCDLEPGQEDFGWYFDFFVGEVRYCFVCGFRPSDDDDLGVWIGWIERSTGFIAGLFGARDKGIDISAPRQIHQVLARTPEISNIRWHFKRDFDVGNEGAGKGSPE